MWKTDIYAILAQALVSINISLLSILIYSISVESKDTLVETSAFDPTPYLF
jgi:hypothetical protein